MQPPARSGASEGRAAVRSNMFIAAVLKGASFSLPVRIRNMSCTGALVEGAAVPSAGSTIQLVRGALAVPGAVVWSNEGRCGLRFASLVAVREWLAPPSNREQQRVDDIFRVIKAGAIPLPIGAASHDAATPSELATDLRAVSKLLESHCEQVLGDPGAVACHGDRLQDLDIVLQTIATVADILVGDADDHSTGSRLQNLRASWQQALARDA
jgi:hypothetical protein